MSEIDEILGTNEKANNQNDWKEQQNKDRQDIYKLMDTMASEVGNNGIKFQKYLDIQSRFFKYSVGNCLVILAKAPTATQIKDKKSWQEKGFELVDNAIEIKILEPSKANDKVYYNPKNVYDITQTNAPIKENAIKYSDRKLLEALLYNCDVPRKAVDTLEDGTVGSEYNKDDNTLYVCKGMEREILFKTLTQEMANIEMKGEVDSNIKSFKSYCISYMICKKYGIDVSDFNFSKLPQEISELREPKAIRAELETIRNTFEKVNTRMTDYFEISNKEKNKTVPER